MRPLRARSIGRQHARANATYSIVCSGTYLLLNLAPQRRRGSRREGRQEIRRHAGDGGMSTMHDEGLLNSEAPEEMHAIAAPLQRSRAGDDTIN